MFRNLSDIKNISREKKEKIMENNPLGKYSEKNQILERKNFKKFNQLSPQIKVKKKKNKRSNSVNSENIPNNVVINIEQVIYIFILGKFKRNYL